MDTVSDDERLCEFTKDFEKQSLSRKCVSLEIIPNNFEGNYSNSEIRNCYNGIDSFTRWRRKEIRFNKNPNLQSDSFSSPNSSEVLEDQEVKETLFKWKIFNILSPEEQVELLERLKYVGVNELLWILKLIINLIDDDKMKYLKDCALKNRDLAEALDLIEIYKYEENELCFVSRVFKEEYTNECFKLFKRKNFEKLAVFQILSIFRNLEENAPENLTNHAYSEFFLLENMSIEASEKELCYLFNVLTRFEFCEGFTEMLCKKLSDKSFLKSFRISSIVRKCLRNSNIGNSQIEAVLSNLIKFVELPKFHNFFKMVKFIIIDCENEPITDKTDFMLDYLFSGDFEYSCSVEWVLRDFIENFCNHKLIYERESFFVFISKHIENLIETGEDVSDLIKAIFKSKKLKNNLVEFFVNYPCCDINFKFVSLFTDFMLFISFESRNLKLLSNFKAVFNSKIGKSNSNSNIEKIVLNLRNKFREAISFMSAMNLEFLLEEFMMKCAEEKYKFIRDSYDLELLIEAIYKFPNLYYISYYFLDSSKVKLSKHNLFKMKYSIILENIFDDVDFEDLNEGCLNKVLNSFYNTPFFAVALPSLIIFAADKEIPPENFLKKIGFSKKLRKSLYEEIIIKRLEKWLSNDDFTKEYKEYVMKVLRSEKNNLSLAQQECLNSEI